MKQNLSNLVAMTIDDSPNMRILVKTILRSFGLQTVLDAKDGEQAMELVRHHEGKIDVIICDWNMEGGSGHDFMKAIRQDTNSPWSRIPVIILSGHAEPSIIQLARDLGINSFLCKPVTPKHLLAHVLKAINKPKDFIANQTYIGPDRRNQQIPVADEKRNVHPGNKTKPAKITFVIDE